eukprot:GHVU01169943.1.p1 GENE.GHVU01169943.1~~GHVU01169943.1.p1  ORF type:complete len:196 (-),score=24.99 GHVU01169943.1:307-894(-)
MAYHCSDQIATALARAERAVRAVLEEAISRTYTEALETAKPSALLTKAHTFPARLMDEVFINQQWSTLHRRAKLIYTPIEGGETRFGLESTPIIGLLPALQWLSPDTKDVDKWKKFIIDVGDSKALQTRVNGEEVTKQANELQTRSSAVESELKSTTGTLDQASLRTSYQQLLDAFNLLMQTICGNDAEAGSSSE